MIIVMPPPPRQASYSWVYCTTLWYSRLLAQVNNHTTILKSILESIVTMASMTSMGQDNRDDDSPVVGNSGQDTTEVCKVWPTAKPKICDKCGESFPSIIKFNAHRSTCKKYKCLKCDLCFITAKELEKHVVTHRVRFICDRCETDHSIQRTNSKITKRTCMVSPSNAHIAPKHSAG